MDDRLSKEIINTNKEYIILEQKYKKQMSQRHAFSNFFKYIISGNIRYAIRQIINSKSIRKQLEYSDAVKTKVDPVPICGKKYNPETDKIAVYTVVTNSYDVVKEPLYISDRIDYYCFTDGEIKQNSAWKFVPLSSLDIDIKGLSAKDVSRYLKFKAHLLFPLYEYSIYIDGSVRIMADLVPIVEHLDDKILGFHSHSGRRNIYEEGVAIKALGKSNKKAIEKQLNKYTLEGFRDDFGLYQCSIIVRQHNHPKCIEVMDVWWEEYNASNTKRDQLSFPYALWRCKFLPSDISIIGNNWETNPRFRVYNHFNRN